FRLTEFRIVGGDDEIALHRQLAAAAERKAGNRGNHRLARIGDAMPGPDEISEEGLGKSLADHFLDVGAGGEGLVGAGDDDAADGVVHFELVDRLSEVAHQRAVERVQGLWAIEPDQADPLTTLDNDGLAHEILVRRLTSGTPGNRTSSGRSGRCA